MRKFKLWIVDITRWSKLRNIGNSVAAKLTILIPIVGYIIIFSDSVLDYLMMAAPFYNVSPLQSLLLVYFGLTVVAVASSIFLIFCPLEIKKYSSATQYICEDDPYLTTISRSVIKSELERTADGVGEKWREISEWHETRPTVELDEHRKRTAEIWRMQMELYYDLLDRKHPPARMIAVTLYFVGFVALLIPSARVFAKVVVILASELF